MFGELPTKTLLLHEEPVMLTIGPQLKKPSTRRTLCYLVREADMGVTQVNLLQDEGDQLVHTVGNIRHEKGIQPDDSLRFTPATQEDIKKFVAPLSNMYEPIKARKLLIQIAKRKNANTELLPEESKRYEEAIKSIR